VFATGGVVDFASSAFDAWLSWVPLARPIATRAALGSEYQERRNQRRFGRTIKFFEVTKLGCRKGAASWAESSGVPFGRVGVLGQASLSAYGTSQLAESLARGRGANSARRNEHTSGTEAG